jgi:predicted transcriptional regulator
MTKLLEQAIAAVRKLPPERQDELAEVLFSLSSDVPRQVTEHEHIVIEAGLVDADAGRFASEEDVSALFAAHQTA